MQVTGITFSKELNYGEIQEKSSISKTVTEGLWRDIPVAIKTFNLDQQVLPTSRYVSEIIEVNSNPHQSLVKIYGVVLKSQRIIVVMERMSTSLFAFVRSPALEKSDQPIKVIHCLINKVIGCVQHYHNTFNEPTKILRSRSLMLTADNEVKLYGAGLHTARAVVCMKDRGEGVDDIVRYRSPQSFKFGHKYSLADDIYALGSIIWEMNAKILPYEDGLSTEVYSRISRGELPKINKEWPHYFVTSMQDCWKLGNEQAKLKDLYKVFESLT